MANFVFATGFESGETLHAYTDASTILPQGGARTGAYCVRTYSGSGGPRITYWSIPAANEYWMGVGFKTSRVGSGRIGFRLSDGTAVYAGRGAGGNTALFIDGTQVAEGPMLWAANAWMYFNMYLKVDDAAGRFKVYQDGVLIGDYTGDTKPNTSTQITGVYMTVTRQDASTYSYIDDVAVSSTEWWGCLCFERLALNADGAVAWTPSTGTANYACVDEVGPNDSDYVSALTNGLQDLYTLGDFDASGDKIPVVVTQHIRAKKTVTDDLAVKPLLKVGGTVHAGAPIQLSSSFANYKTIYNLTPTGGQWSDSLIDGLEAGVEAVIP